MKRITNRTHGLVGIIAAIGLCFLTSYSYAGVGHNYVGQNHKPAIVKGGGNVLPPTAQPRGYSLFQMAKATASFNTTDRSGSVVPIPRTPFRILYTTASNPTNTFNVKTGDMLYIPVVYNDDSLPVIGHFPDVYNRWALLNYFYSQQEFGTVFTKIIVDGKETSLGSDYLVGVKFSQPLPDGALNYMTSAAFLTPFKKGRHTVEISSRATGAAFSAPDIIVYFPGGIFEFSTVYTVNVH